MSHSSFLAPLGSLGAHTAAFNVVLDAIYAKDDQQQQQQPTQQDEEKVQSHSFTRSGKAMIFKF